MTQLLLFLLLVAVIAVLIQQRKLIMTIEEYKTEVGALGEKLAKVLTEILNMIQVGHTVSQEDVDKLNAAKDVAQQLDDLNPDA